MTFPGALPARSPAAHPSRPADTHRGAGPFRANPFRAGPLVDRTLVHRTAPGEVLLTGSQDLGHQRFLVGARWPHHHRPRSAAPGGSHHPLLIAESLRQACILLSVRYFQVPVHTHFVIRDLSLACESGALPIDQKDSTDVLMEVTASEHRFDESTGRLGAMALHATLHVSGIPFATTAGSARLFDPAGYAALRSSAAVNASPLSHPTARRDLHRPDPRQVGLIRADDVVLARSADDQPWFVSPADPRHPFFHDHRVDHHPGMLLLEAARQHALLTLGRPGLRLSTATIRPLRFAEHTSPATLAAAPGADASHFPFHIRQLGRAVLEGALSFAAAP